MEQWKSITGYEGLYEVSSLGRVRSLWDGRLQIHRTKVLKPMKNKCGYLFVVLFKNGERKMFRVHRLVSEAFIDNPLNKQEVNHKDEDKTNNRVDNLEWMTRNENINYGTHNERVAKAHINHPKLSKPVLQFTKDEIFVNEYPSIKEVERQTGIANQSISACCIGKRKSAGGSVWKYKE